MWEIDFSDSLLEPTDLVLDKLPLKVGTFLFFLCVYCFSVIQKDHGLIGASEVLASFFKPLLILTRCIMAYEIVHYIITYRRLRVQLKGTAPMANSYKLDPVSGFCRHLRRLQI